MLERRENVHFCCRCGKGMAYEEKSMVYLYKVQKTVKNLLCRDGRKMQTSKTVPKAQRAYNLCDDCAKGFSELLDIFIALE